MPASAYGQIQITKPKNWQDFEQGSSILWRKILNDDSLHLFGRGGQEQYGLDMFGYRDGDPSKIVGIQCKCKGHDKQATEEEFRRDFEKALAYEIPLTEYYFTTTADDHAPLQAFAVKLSQEQLQLGRKIIVRAWGWGTIERRLQELDLATIFNPPGSAPLLKEEQYQEILARLDTLKTSISPPTPILPADSSPSGLNPADAVIDAEIDRYRDLMSEGQPRSALKLLRHLLGTLTDANSGHVWFRVKANIGHCYLHMGDEQTGIEYLDQAVEHAPNDPKATANAVLALTLKGDNSGALDLARRKLNDDPENEVLAAYAIQAAGRLGVDDLLSLIPERLRDTDAVQKYLIFALRAKADPTWMDLARKGYERDQKDAFFRQYRAEADIESIVSGEHANTWRLEPKDRDVLRNAADDLVDLWQEAKKQEVPERQDNLVLCLNAVSALLLIGEFAQAGELVRDGLTVKPHDTDLLVKAAAVGMEINDKKLYQSVFDELPESGVGLLLRVQIAARDGNWKYLTALSQDDRVNTVPDTEVSTVKALVKTAHAKSISRKDRTTARQMLSDLIQEFEGLPRALVLVSNMARDLQLKDVDELAYMAAVSSISEKSHISSRFMVADYAARRRDHSVVIRMLDGHVDTSVISSELVELASAFAYQYPAKASGLAFFTSLPPGVRDTHDMAVLEGVLHTHRQDLGAAAECFSKAVELAPRDLRSLLMLAQTYVRQGDQPAALAAARDIDPSQMEGTLLDRMNLSQLLGMAGRKDVAFELGYETLQEGRNDPDVVLKWIGLGLENLEYLVGLSGGAVDVGMWVRLKSSDGQVNEFTIVNGPNRPADGEYGRDHSLAGRSIGLRAGEGFDKVDNLGREHRWTVEDVRHRYHHAYQDAVDHFNDRFPDAKGFWVIKTQGDDISPLLDLVRRQGERQQKLLDLVSNPSVPLAFVAELTDSSVIRLEETLRFNGLEIDVCDNTVPERNQAIAAVGRFRGKGAVLDTLTHWTVVGLGALDVLQSVFGSLSVARSTLDDVIGLKEDRSHFEGTERGGTAFFHDGQFFFDEMTEDREKAIAAAIDDREATLVGGDINVMPVHAPEDFDPELAQFINRGALDPIFVAKECGALLISEDKRYRAYARTFGLDAAWLQMVFLYARRQHLITPERYALLSADLASLRHGSIMIEAADIERVVEQSTPETRYRLYAIATAIGTKNADPVSHLRALIVTIHRLWSAGPTLDGRLMTGLLLRNALRFHPEQHGWIMSAVADALSGYPGGFEYLNNWKTGHFYRD